MWNNAKPNQITFFNTTKYGGFIERERERVNVACGHSYDDIISVENLLLAWREFLNGKRKRKDVEEFSINLGDNILSLHQDLVGRTYRHGPYQAFKVNDPKPRDIHKATVRDRLLHHAIYRILYPYFDTKFIFDSYSCRVGKGTHRAVNRLREYANEVSHNNTRTVWVLKCDIKKFFANIDHEILISILRKHTKDEDVIWLLRQVIGSFNSGRPEAGLPLGNLTSQLLVNIYMNEFDHFAKRDLKLEHYIRYADDFVILSNSRDSLISVLSRIDIFLETKLRLRLHPSKVFIKTLDSGIDFLGWVNFPKHRVLRTSTRRRMFKNIEASHNSETVQSYLGLLKHGDTCKIRNFIYPLLKVKK